MNALNLRMGAVGRLASLSAAIWLLAATPVLAGDIDHVNLFRNIGYTQTANGQSLANNGTFFSTAVYTLGATAYSSVSFTAPAASPPVAMPALGANSYGYVSAAFGSQAAMDAAFPSGAYNYTLLSSGPAVQVALTLGADRYPLSQPFLSGTGYSALQGANAAAPIAVQFSTFSTNAAATWSYIYFTAFMRSPA